MKGAKKVIFLASVLVLAAGLTWFGGAGRSAREKTTGAGNIYLPDLTFEDYQGQEVSLADFRGRVLMVNSWASWCSLCVTQMSDLAAVQEEMAGQIALVLVNRAESRATVKSFSDRVGFKGRLVFVLDPADSFYKSIGGFSMPETVFADQEGLIVQRRHGPMGLEEMRRRAKEILGR